MKFSLIILLASCQIFSQSYWQPFVSKYAEEDFEWIESHLATVPAEDTSSLAYLFFRSLFIEDAESARANYEKIYHQREGYLRELAAERLHDYYFALGLYQKAEKYASLEEMIPETGNITSTKTRGTGNYIIQVGAFSQQENARKRLQWIMTHQFSGWIVPRVIGQNSYYCVWVQGYDSVEETKKLAEQIKRKCNIEYRIIKP